MGAGFRSDCGSDSISGGGSSRDGLRGGGSGWSWAEMSLESTGGRHGVDMNLKGI